MYTWGYMKENILSKLNMSEDEANQLGYLSSFPFYANEAMTQICSAIKPKDKYFIVQIDDSTVNTEIEMPTDFVSFADEPVTMSIDNEFCEVHDDIFEYVGYNSILCKENGIYKVPYNARWFFFTKDLANETTLAIPADIIDSIPSYIVSQCYKIDDELKAATYRNEYEMFLARIDNTSFKAQRTFKIGGGW